MLDRLEAMALELERRPHLLRLGRLFSETILLQVDAEEYLLHFERGRIAGIETGPDRKIPWRFAFKTEFEALQAFWQPVPAPGFHDIFGLVKIGRARIDGDILLLVKNLRFFKEFMALGRQRDGVHSA